MEPSLNIVLLDKHQLFREGVKQVLETEPSFHIVVSSDDYSVLTSAVEVYGIDIVLIDVNMFKEHQLQVTQMVRNFEIKIIVISGNEEGKYVTSAIKAGVHGYLLKEMDIYSFVNAIKIVQFGNFYIHPSASDELVKDYLKLMQQETDVKIPLHLFSRRECEVLQLLADGESNKKMAETLNISEKTVKNHVSSLFKKMKVNDRTNAVVKAIRNHWVKFP